MRRKRTVLIFSVVVSGFLLVWNVMGNYAICNFLVTDGALTNCPFILTKVGINFFPIIPLFLFSLITYKMRDEIYRAWLRFAYVWIPLSMVAILLAPEYSGDWMYPVVKGTVAFFSSVLFALVSLGIIIWRYATVKDRATGYK